jgi:hypothetical protein
VRRLTDQQLAHTEHVAALQAEHDLRERQPPALHTLEEQERTAALQPAAVGSGGESATVPAGGVRSSRLLSRGRPRGDAARPR